MYTINNDTKQLILTDLITNDYYVCFYNGSTLVETFQVTSKMYASTNKASGVTGVDKTPDLVYYISEDVSDLFKASSLYLKLSLVDTTSSITYDTIKVYLGSSLTTLVMDGSLGSAVTLPIGTTKDFHIMVNI